jgi:phytanoyl-CoA hydroxylase
MPALTQQQIAQFHQDGFLIVKDLLSAVWVSRLVDRMEPLFAGEFETGRYPDEWYWNPYLSWPQASGQMSNVWKSDRTFAAVSLSAQLGAISAALAGWTGSRLLSDSLWRKPCGAGETTLHQDSMYSFYHTPQEIVVCWMALTKATIGGSTIEYVRGSHHWALSDAVSEFHASSGDYRWPLQQAAKRAGIEHPDVVQLELKAGDCVFHHGHMWHGSGKNCLPDFIRRSLVVVHIPAVSRFKPTGTYVPGGYIAGRYKRFGDDTMDESFFPIVWRQADEPSAFIADYCGDALAPMLIAA